MSSSFSFPRKPGEENMSMAEILSTYPKEFQDQFFGALDEEQADNLRYDADFWLRPKQQFDNDNDWYITAYVGGRGGGKSQSIKTPIPTPNGWSILGDIKDGDIVFDENGKPCKVVKAHDIFTPEKAYRFTFSDNTFIDSCSEHLWTTWTHAARKAYNRSKFKDTPVPEDWPTWTNRNRWGHSLGGGPKTLSTQDIVDTFRHGKRGDLNHSIPLAKPLEYEEKNLPIDPWVYGVFLGDGTIRTAQITSHVDESDWLISMFEERGYPLKRIARLKSRNDEGILVEKNCNTLEFHGLKDDLRDAGVLDDKRILDTYRYGSIKQRTDVLSGLMDTDGYISETNKVEFVAKRKEHSEFVLELARSLGQKPILAVGRATLYGKDCGPKYRVTWRPTTNAPFYMPRKVQRFTPPEAQASRNFHRMITKFEEIAPTPMRCLTVDSPNNLFLIGEGMIPTHNTRAGAEWVRKKARENPGCRIALGGRTVADVRNVLVQGESGILNISPESERPEYKQHLATLTWPNGSSALLLSSESPDQARGPQFHYTLGDEFAAWKTAKDASGATLYDNLLAATRLGENPQLVLTTTPKRTQVMKEIMARSKDPEQKVRLITGSTMENRSLSKAYIENLKRQYGDSDLAKQEIDGIMLEDADGVVFSEELISKAKDVGTIPNNLYYIIAVDPSVAADPKTADECGIMVLGCTRENDPFDRKVFVIEDASLRAAPDVWADRIVELSKKYRIRDVVAESNQGGALITSIINTRAPSLKVHLVHASQGKVKRVEPVIVAMQQGRVKFAEDFPTLEDQLLYYDPDTSGYSPDRMDAFAWGVTALVISPPKTLAFSTIRVQVPKGIVVPNTRMIDALRSGSHHRRSLPPR